VLATSETPHQAIVFQCGSNLDEFCGSVKARIMTILALLAVVRCVGPGRRRLHPSDICCFERRCSICQAVAGVCTQGNAMWDECSYFSRERSSFFFSMLPLLNAFAICTNPQSIACCLQCEVMYEASDKLLCGNVMYVSGVRSSEDSRRHSHGQSSHKGT